MKISARNVFYGTVQDIKQGAVNAEVTLGLIEGIEIYMVKGSTRPASRKPFSRRRQLSQPPQAFPSGEGS